MKSPSAQSNAQENSPAKKPVHHRHLAAQYLRHSAQTAAARPRAHPPAQTPAEARHHTPPAHCAKQHIAAPVFQFAPAPFAIASWKTATRQHLPTPIPRDPPVHSRARQPHPKTHAEFPYRYPGCTPHLFHRACTKAGEPQPRSRTSHNAPNPATNPTPSHPLAKPDMPARSLPHPAIQTTQSHLSDRPNARRAYTPHPPRTAPHPLTHSTHTDLTSHMAQKLSLPKAKKTGTPTSPFASDTKTSRQTRPLVGST